ncbi:MAG: DUF3326 domain-containing protein [Candidatus Gastranaerophilales bacterium]|nr:DUF3326 domain-containing protein [Candidatus Gastranaerophilales bacterium]
MNKFEKVSVFIVPTGIGASIGGFAGDASVYAKKISEVCPLIVNPNVVNAAVFSGINANMLYTEGFAIDSFFKKEIALRPSFNNKIGVIFDKKMPKSILNVHLNTIGAVETVYGIEILDYEITQEEVGVEFNYTADGISSGSLRNPKTLLQSANNLIKRGAEAIAVVCHFDECEDDGYSQGEGVDIVGGVEAIISHLITREFNVPTAHAPAFSNISISTRRVDKRAAAEFITPTFLPCILIGLNNAPKLIPINQSQKTDLTLENVKSLIMPANSLGGVPVLKAIEENIPVFAVKENKTILNISQNNLFESKNIINVETYEEIIKHLAY